MIYYCEYNYRKLTFRSWGQHSLHRSVSQPSLARSATEVVEQWTAPEGDVTPTPGRRIRGNNRIKTISH